MNRRRQHHRQGADERTPLMNPTLKAAQHPTVAPAVEDKLAPHQRAVFDAVNAGHCSDLTIAAHTRLPLERVRSVLPVLDALGFVVRDALDTWRPRA